MTAAVRSFPVALLALGAGLSAACLYTSHPILGLMADGLAVRSEQIGWLPTATQAGYAVGLLLFAPLGDKLERRAVIVSKCAVLALSLCAVAAAKSLPLLVIASFGTGLAATVAQDYVPAAATLATPENRGRVVGTTMTGLLLGILLSRTVSGWVGEHWGWRAPFWLCAATIALLGLLSWLRLPLFPPSAHDSYRALLASLGKLLFDNRELRRAIVTQGSLSVAFGGFWSTLAIAVAAPPLRLGSAAAGAFGLAGAAGALIAPVAGALADRRGPRAVIRVGTALTALAFAAMALGPSSLPVLVLGTVLFDLGTQGSLISHQSIVYSLDPSARSRLNALLVSGMFVGMALGSALASRVLAQFGWAAVCWMSTAMALLAAVLGFRRR